MATFDYGPIRKDGIALIKEFGRPVPCQVQRTVDGSPVDPSKPWRPSAATMLVFQFTGVVLPFVIKRQVDLDPDTIIYAPGDIIATAADSDPNTLCGRIRPSDNITSQGVVYSIIGMHELTPGADPIFFNMRCRSWPSDTTTPAITF